MKRHGVGKARSYYSVIVYFEVRKHFLKKIYGLQPIKFNLHPFFAWVNTRVHAYSDFFFFRGKVDSEFWHGRDFYFCFKKQDFFNADTKAKLGTCVEM